MFFSKQLVKLRNQNLCPAEKPIAAKAAKLAERNEPKN
jgi:hypothetical protein